MVLFLILLALIIVSGLNAKGKNEFYTDYCSPKNTSTVNAVFSVLIFLSHSAAYLDFSSSAMNSSYFLIRNFLSQTVVVTYLFYSGYGIMESIKKKGHSYVKRMPIDRFFKLWYHFAIIIMMFIAVALISNKNFTLSDYLLAFTGFKSIGNSNWYMFVTFSLYIILFIAFMIFKKSNILGVCSMFILTAAFVLVEMKALNLSVIFYDTIFCFPLGMAFSLIKPFVDKIVMKNDIIWLVVTSAVFTICMYGAQNRAEHIFYRILFMCTAPIFITLLTMKLQCKSTILDWFGSHIFSFFMLQRIPMLLLQYLNFDNEPYLFIGLSFFATVFLATVFDEFTDWLDKIIFKKKIKA